MFDLSLAQVLFRLLAIVVVAGIHGFLVALVARVLGDKGPQYDGRLTLNPFTHLDFVGAIAGILSRVGWIQPVAIDPGQLRGKRWGLVAVVVASCVLTVAVGYLLLQLRIPGNMMLGPSAATQVSNALGFIFETAVWFSVCNLLPIFPLTGGHLLMAASPPLGRLNLQYQLYVGIALAVVLALAGNTILRPVIAPLTQAAGL